LYDDKKNGHGVQTFPNGNVYEGKFKDGQQSGHGVLMTANYRYEGDWKK